MILQCNEVGLVALRQAIAVGTEHHLFVRRKGVERDFDGGDKAQRALTSTDEFAEVDGCVAVVASYAFVNGITATAALQAGVREIVVYELPNRGVSLP